jgi:hypothetical protein
LTQFSIGCHCGDKEEEREITQKEKKEGPRSSRRFKRRHLGHRQSHACQKKV